MVELISPFTYIEIKQTSKEIRGIKIINTKLFKECKNTYIMIKFFFILSICCSLFISCGNSVKKTTDTSDTHSHENCNHNHTSTSDEHHHHGDSDHHHNKQEEFEVEEEDLSHESCAVNNKTKCNNDCHNKHENHDHHSNTEHKH